MAAASNATSGDVIKIPYGDGSGKTTTVAIPASRLPSDPSQVLKVLRGSVGALRLWLDVAVAYYRRGQIHAFTTVLSEGIDEENAKPHLMGDVSATEDRMDMINALAGHYLLRARAESDDQRRQEMLARANGLVTRAHTLEEQYDMNWVTRGLHFLATNRHRDARMQFDNALDIEADNFPAILGLACVSYHEKKWVEARRLYAKAIRMHPQCPASVRVGLGMCLFKLGHVAAATKAMERALELDPGNVDAMSALAVLKRYHRPRTAKPLSLEEEAKSVAQAMELVVKGYKLDRTNPIICNQLAHHVFWKWHQLPCTAAVTKGSTKVQLSSSATTMLQPNHPVRIGPTETHVVATLSGDVLTLTAAYQGETAAEARVYHRKFDTAMELAKAALKSTKNKEIMAEANYIVGRCHHAVGNFDQAHVWYSKALRDWPEFVLPLYGLAQTLLKQQRYDNALTRINQVLKAHPDNVGALKIAAGAHLRHQPPRVNEALVCLKRAVELYPDDVEALIHLALLYQHQPGRQSLIAARKAYEHAYRVLYMAKRPIPPQLLVNLAALRHRLGDGRAAMRMYEKALGNVAEAQGKSADKWQEVMYSDACVSTTFNMALLLEEMGQLTRADEVYTNILREHPNYSQCYVRKAAIMSRLGRLGAAEQWLHRGIQVKGSKMPSCREAYAMLSKVYLDMGNLAAARSTVHKLIQVEEKSGRRTSEFGRLFVANLDMESGELSRRSLESVHKKYLSVLKAYPRNIFAANGYATALAEYGVLAQAKAAFEGIREDAEGVPDVLLNLAHTHLQLHEYEQAIQVYRKVLSRFRPSARDTQVMMYLANALFERATTSAVEVNELDRAAAIRECILILRKAVHLSPGDATLRYNLGVVLNESAVRVLSRDSTERSVEDVREAVRRLRLASPIVSWLAAEERVTGVALYGPGTTSGIAYREATPVGDEASSAAAAGAGAGAGAGAEAGAGADAATKKTKQYTVGLRYSLKGCRDRAEHIKETLEHGKQHLEYDERMAATAAEERDKQAQKLQQLREEREALRRREEEAQLEAVRDRERQAQEFRRALEAENKAWAEEMAERAAQEEAAKKRRGGKKKKKKPRREQFEEEEEDVPMPSFSDGEGGGAKIADSDDDDDGPVVQASQSGDEEEVDDDAQKNKIMNLFGESDDDDEEEEEEQKGSDAAADETTAASTPTVADDGDDEPALTGGAKKRRRAIVDSDEEDEEEAEEVASADASAASEKDPEKPSAAKRRRTDGPEGSENGDDE